MLLGKSVHCGWLFTERWFFLSVYAQWLRRFNDADLLPPEPRSAAIEALAAELERDLTLVGSTAIEDKLQAGVPETIMRFLTANIKVWVLTGDKMVCVSTLPVSVLASFLCFQRILTSHMGTRDTIVGLL